VKNRLFITKYSPPKTRYRLFQCATNMASTIIFHQILDAPPCIEKRMANECINE